MAGVRAFEDSAVLLLARRASRRACGWLWSMLPISPARWGLGRRLEKQLNVATQVIETFGRGRRASFSFRQDEAALDHRLGVQGEALRRPILRAPMFAHRRAN